MTIIWNFIVLLLFISTVVNAQQNIVIISSPDLSDAVQSITPAAADPVRTPSHSRNSGADAVLSGTVSTARITFFDGVSVGTVNTSANQQAVSARTVHSETQTLQAYEADNSVGMPSSSSATAMLTANLRIPANLVAGAPAAPMVVADFNGDGKADLALSAFNSGQALVLIGNGNGTFQPGIAYGRAAAVRYLASGDFNRDGKADLALADSTGTVSILLGNGDGSFQAALTYRATTTSAIAIAVADFDRDGKLDLAVSDDIAGSVGLLLGNGDGSFQPSISLAAGPHPGALGVADFNGDGKMDLVAADSQEGLLVLFGNGNGTFQPAVNYSAAGSPTALAVGDVNGDGKPDLVITASSSSVLGVLVNNGDGSFQAPVIMTAPQSPTSLAVGDLNGDGKLDIVAGTDRAIGANAFGVLFGNGDGTFQAALSFTGDPLRSAALADFNGDGRIDLIGIGGFRAAANSAVSPVTQTGGASIAKVTSGNLSPLVGSSAQTVSPAASGTPTVVIEIPSNGASVSLGTVAVSGWALDNANTIGTAISSIQVLLDGTFVGNAFYGINRADICNQLPGRPGCPNVGFSATVTIPVGSHSIGIQAANSDPVPVLGGDAVTVTAQGAMTGTRVGVFRNSAAFLEDTNGSQAYEPGMDHFVSSFSGPGGPVAGDIPVTGDWAGDGHMRVGIYRAASGTWFLDLNNSGTFDAGDLTYQFGGLSGDVPFSGDWTAKGKSCIGIYRPSGGVWLLDLNCNGVFENTPTDAFFPFGGLQGDVPVVGAWFGGTTRVGVVRKYAPGGVPQGQPFFWLLDSAAADAGNLPGNHPAAARPFAFGGLAGDVFVTGDWYNTGVYCAGVYRAGFWVLDAARPGAPEGSHVPGLTFGYGGVAGDMPVTGKW